MSVDEASIATLMKLGLTQYEAKIFLTLVKMGGRTASEISFSGKVPRTKTYGAISSLREKGLIKILPGKPEKYMASAPDGVLQPLAEKFAKDAEACSRLVADLSMIYESSKYIYQEKPYEKHDVWTLSQRSKVVERVRASIESSQKYIRMTTTANGLVRAYKLYLDHLEKAASKGSSVMLQATVNRENLMVAKKIAELVKVRHLPPPVLEFVVVDGKDLLLIESAPDNFEVEEGQDQAAWTNSPLMVRAFELHFDKLWPNLVSPNEAVKG